MFTMPENISIIIDFQEFKIDKFLGEGTLGGVWKIKNQFKKSFTLKLFYKDNLEFIKENFHNRMELLKSIKSKYILSVKKYGFLETNGLTPVIKNNQWKNIDKNIGIPFIIQPYGEYNFDQFLVTTFDKLTRIKLAIKLCFGIREIGRHYRHFNNTIGNLSFSNILIFERKNSKSLKLTDVGLDYFKKDLKNNKTIFSKNITFIELIKKLLKEPPKAILDLLNNNTSIKMQRLVEQIIYILYDELSLLQKKDLAKSSYILGLNLYEKEEYEYALKDFEKALTFDPKFIDAIIYKANTLKLMDKLDESLSLYNHAINLEPDNPLIYENRAELYAQKEEYTKSIDDLKKAIDLDPTAESAYGSLGLIYNLLQEWEQSLIQFNKLIDLNNTFALAYIDRANVFMNLKNYENAIIDFKKALELGIDDTEEIDEINKQIKTAENLS